MKRCGWVPKDKAVYLKYHDEEWGVPIHDDRKLFEFLVLESFQAGLSWLTVLNKRESFRKAFDNFDAEKVAYYDDDKVERLMSDKGIIRNRLKISAAVNNARIFLQLQEEFGSFDNYIWQFVEGKPIVNAYKNWKDIPTKTEISDIMSKDMGQRGFKFRGSTICYAFMQAVGMFNDHETSCFRYREILETY